MKQKPTVIARVLPTSYSSRPSQPLNWPKVLAVLVFFSLGTFLLALPW